MNPISSDIEYAANALKFNNKADAQYNYNLEMIAYKQNKQNLFKIPFFNNNLRKPEVPEDCLDVSDWDIKTIQEFTEHLTKTNNSSLNENNNSFFTYTNSNTLENLEKKLKILQNDLEDLKKDGRYDNDGNHTLRPFDNDMYINDYSDIINEIKNIEKQIKDEKDRLKNMSGKGGKSRTKQHYRNKSNKRKSRKSKKSKKSKRKSIKK